MSYRPEEFKNPQLQSVNGRLPSQLEKSIYDWGANAGADAMLEGLKKTHYKLSDGGEYSIIDTRYKSGYLVFIPDEEK